MGRLDKLKSLRLSYWGKFTESLVIIREFSLHNMKNDPLIMQEIGQYLWHHGSRSFWIFLIKKTSNFVVRYVPEKILSLCEGNAAIFHTIPGLK